MTLMKVVSILMSLLLIGCPPEGESDGCPKTMKCETDREMVCFELDNGCKDECHYYVFEQCYEVCLHEIEKSNTQVVEVLR